MRTHAVRTFFWYPPPLIAFLGTASYLSDNAKNTYVRYLAVDAVYCYAIGFAVYVAYAAFYAFLCKVGDFQLGGRSIERSIPVHLGLTMAGLTGGMLLAGRVLSNVLHQEPMSTQEWLGGLMTGAVIGLVFILFYAYTKTHEWVKRLEKATLESQYRTLKDQMQPHFLFNSLNGLSELIQSNTDEASHMAARLSDLYRKILENSKSKTNPLKTELSIVDDYLTLQKLRFGDSLTYQIENAVEGDDPYVPSLMLQTLVENAIKHGIGQSTKGGVISIEAKRTAAGAGCELHIRNTGCGLQSNPGRGTGLVNTQQRLELLYGSNHGFSIRTNQNLETEVRFRVTGERFE